jgi:hypothetical protein
MPLLPWARCSSALPLTRRLACTAFEVKTESYDDSYLLGSYKCGKQRSMRSSAGSLASLPICSLQRGGT